MVIGYWLYTVIELISIYYAPDFIKYTLDDEKYIIADVLQKIQILLKVIVKKMKS